MRQKFDIAMLLLIVMVVSTFGTMHAHASLEFNYVEIVDTKGEPVKGAEVQVYDVATRKYLSTVYTDAFGIVDLGSMGKGDFGLSILKKGYGYLKQQITMPTQNNRLTLPSFEEADNAKRANGDKPTVTYGENPKNEMCQGTNEKSCPSQADHKYVAPLEIIDNRPKGDMDPIWCLCCWWCALDYSEETWNWAKVSEVHSFPYMTMTYSDYYAADFTETWSFGWEAKEQWDGGGFGSSGSVTVSYMFSSSTGHVLSVSNGEDQNIYQQFKFRHEHWHCYGLFGDLWHQVDDIYVVGFSASSFDHRAEYPSGDQNANFWNSGWLGSQSTYGGPHETWVENTVSKSLTVSSSITAGIFTVSCTDSISLSKNIKYDMNFQGGHYWDIYTNNRFVVYGYYHNDAGTGRDAGGSFAEATSIGTGYWSNCYLGGWDGNDWYQFYVTSGKYIYTYISPYWADFDLELYDPNNQWRAGSYYGGTSTDSISFTADKTGYWRVRAYVWSGLGEYRFYLYVYSGGGGGGCPYVSTWNGFEHQLDNNVLAGSENDWSFHGNDHTDYYTLQKPLGVNGNGKYEATLSEFEQEHDFIDQFQLLAVDHEQEVNVAASPYGEVLTYTDPVPPVTALDEDHQNLKSVLASPDGVYYHAHPGSYIDLNFGDEVDVSNGAKLVFRSDMPAVKTSIHIEVQDAKGGWKDVAAFIPRVNWAIDIIDMSDYLPDAKGNLKVRLYFTAAHKLDFVGLDTRPQAPITVQECQLFAAISSSMGLVTGRLLYKDGDYAEMVPGEQIVLEFAPCPETSNCARTFIVIVAGHYTLMS